MHKTIYIDVDEEIMGIINKIRKTEEEEIFLVVPKNSLLTQGIVNLKLLKKEVSKLYKKIILVTSDQHSKRIIKQVGLETKSKSVQDFVPEEENPKINPENIPEKEEFPESKDIEVQTKPKKREIGASSFYEEFSDEKLTPPTPKKDEGLVSPEAEKTKLKVHTPNTFGSEYIENYESKQKLGAKESFIEEKINFKKEDLLPKPSIDDFYKKPVDKEKSLSKSDVFKKPRKEKKRKFTIANKKRFSLLLLFLILFITIPAVLMLFSGWPKMVVELFLKESAIETSLELTICDEKTAGSECLKGDYQELTIEVTQNYESSGEIFSNDKGMARGVVKIYNNYSSQKQALVEKTRLLSTDGKLFRLIKGVTVPGMQDDQPGVVEALVIADEIGQSFNIGPSEFTIEGFKGNEKYEKFKVISETDMTGGANDIENKKVKVVTESDINSARENTIDYLNANLEEEIQKQLTDEETFVISSIDKEIVNSDSSYAPGDIIDQFNYTIKETIKVITFNEEDFKELIIEKFESEVEDDYKFDEISSLDFQKDVANYQNKTLDLAISAEAIYWPVMDTDTIKENLTNKSNSEIKTYLGELNKINKALITYKPAWLSSFPVKNKNITIKEIK